MRHFRLAKGWKKEIDEVSISAVIIALIITSVSAVETAKAAGGLIFWGRILAIKEVCLATPIDNTVAGNVICASTELTAPHIIILVQGNRPIVAMKPTLSLGSAKYAKIGGLVIGNGFQLSSAWYAA